MYIVACECVSECLSFFTLKYKYPSKTVSSTSDVSKFKPLTCQKHVFYLMIFISIMNSHSNLASWCLAYRNNLVFFEFKKKRRNCKPAMLKYTCSIKRWLLLILFYFIFKLNRIEKEWWFNGALPAVKIDSEVNIFLHLFME